MNNKAIAKIFENIATLLKVKGESPFKIRAYIKAAATIRELHSDLSTIMENNGLRELPGIGEALEKKINELITTGKLAYYEKLCAESPEGITFLLNIHGLDPQIAYRLYTELHLATIDEIERAIMDGRVIALPDTGEGIAGTILNQIHKTKLETGTT